jgi:hypothetical protein
MKFFVFALLCVGGVAHANCPQDTEVLFSCDIAHSSKRLATCLHGDEVSYEFGAQGWPELEMTRHVRDVEFMPWPGVGQNLWETTTLSNQDHEYRMTYVINREGASEADDYSIRGFLEVYRDGSKLVQLECEPQTLLFSGYPSYLYDAKRAAGQVWNLEAQRWDEAGLE